MAKVFIFGSAQLAMKKLCDVLRREGYDVHICTPEDIPSHQEGVRPLILLDARVKWSLCRPLLERFQQNGYSILFLTADRRMVTHLRALYAGTSDVLVLPVAQKMLTSKVAGLMGENEPAPLRDLAVDEQERVALLDGQRVELTAQEYALLLALMENPDIPISREQLLRKAWGYQSMGETRTVDVHVQRLRKKLGGERIETVYKCGYRLKMA